MAVEVVSQLGAGVINRPVINAPKAGLIYGPSDTGKTSQIRYMAKWVWNKYHKKTRLVSADGGGWSPLQSYIDLGIVVPFSLLGRKNPGQDMKFLLEGHWPLEDGTLGTAKTAPTPATWEEFGAYGFEGLYSISSLLMSHHSHEGTLEGMSGGAMSRGGGSQESSKIKDGLDVWTQPGQGFYSFILQKMHKYVTQSSALPVEKVLWTTLLSVFEKKNKQQEVVEHGPWGPAMVGQQGIKLIPQWFGDLIHLDVLHTAVEQEMIPGADGKPQARTDTQAPKSKVGELKKLVRAYLKTHTHPRDGELVPAKPRVDPTQYSLVPAYKDFTAEEGFIDWLYDLEDRLGALGTEVARKELGL